MLKTRILIDQALCVYDLKERERERKSKKIGFVMMDHMVSRERDYEVDLESGGTTSEEEGREDRASRVGQAKKSLDKVWDGFMGIDKSIRGDRGVSPFDSISISSDVPAENAEELRERSSEVEEHTMGLLEKKRAKEKRKKTISKKPPRPPRGPSLDAADQKMVKEISELAMLKRARIERMKASKKMKAAKAASPNSNLCAMIITIMFCLVIIFQGMFSRGSPQVGSDGSTRQEAVTNGRRLISVQYFKNISPKSSDGSDSSVPDSESPHRTNLPSGLPSR